MAAIVVAESAIVVDGVVIPRMNMDSEVVVTAVMAERAVVAVAARGRGIDYKLSAREARAWF
eukprot:9441755-Pyramimonas_sp.AAC.1